MEKPLTEEIATWHSRIPAGVTLVAISKQQPSHKVLTAYEMGQRHFGENRAPALKERYESLPKDIHWHMVGHLQRNKVALIAPFVYLIQSVDSVRLLLQLEEEGKKQNRLLRCLLQVHIATGEPHKHGLRREELQNILQGDLLDPLRYLQIEGLMGMASHTNDTSLLKSELGHLQEQFHTLKREIRHPRVQMRTLSIGMSHDYKEALSAGSNMLRIGSAYFGERPQKTT